MLGVGLGQVPGAGVGQCREQGWGSRQRSGDQCFRVAGCGFGGTLSTPSSCYSGLLSWHSVSQTSNAWIIRFQISSVIALAGVKPAKSRTCVAPHAAAERICVSTRATIA